jgi:small-conductance mechanosensitive channel
MARPTDRAKPRTPPPRSPFLPPAPHKQLPPAAPALQQRAWAGLVLALLSLITMLLIGNLARAVYVAGVALAVAVVALILTITALSAAKRDGTGRPRGAVAGVVLGVLGALFSAFALVGFLVFWSQLMQYAHCMNGASTVAARSACQQQFDNSVSAEITLLGGGR